MILECLGSESAGNSYILKADSGEVLLLEAGINFKEVKKALGYNLSGVVGCFVTHAHFDHSKYIRDFAKAGIDCYCNQDTIEKLSLQSNHRVQNMPEKKLFHIGRFTIIPFSVVHNVPCNGFLIHHPESGKILFATDAAFIPHRFTGLSHILIEANYSDEAMVSDRAVGHHMALDTALTFIRQNVSPTLRNVVLLHLSATNSDEKQFIKEVKSVAPCADVVAADKGVVVNLSINPF